MSPSDFDSIARELAAGEISRRSALKRLAGAGLGLGAAIVPAGVSEAMGGGCPPGRKKCGKRCCPKNARCQRGRCKCKPGFRKCGRKCVDTDTSIKHCGACGDACGTGQACVDGDCVTQICTPAQTQPCYEGPPGTQGVGVCQGGTRTCNAQGTAYGPCVGQVLPSQEICDNGQDDDCDGLVDGADGDNCCTPTCPPLTCGDDGCGGSCVCEAGFVCDSGQCVELECTLDNECPNLDQCNVGVCTNGICETTPRPNNTLCSDGNACTQNDTCQDGVCVGAGPVVCQPLDECHLAGTCNPATGQCSNPVAPDGTPCTGGACLSGACYQCVPSGPEVCNCIDDNCNGFIDEDPLGTGASCDCGETEGVTVCAGCSLVCSCP